MVTTARLAKPLCGLLLALVLAGCGGAPAEDGGGPADVSDNSGDQPGAGGGGNDNGGGTQAPPPNRQAQHDQTMQLMASPALGCANCHSARDGQAGDLNLETGTLDELAARLVARRASSQNCPDEILVNPVDPEGSLFLRLVSPHASGAACIAKMPLGSNGVSAADYEVLRVWVNALIATYMEQDDDFDVGGGGDDNTSGIVTSEVATPADPLDVLSRVKYVVTGGPVTQAELDGATTSSGELDRTAFGLLVDEWLASEDFTTKRESFFKLALQQDPADKNYVQQLRNSRNLMPGDVVRNLEASLIRTAERVYSDGEDFRSLFWTTRHEVTTATLLVYKMLDNPVMRPRTGTFDKGNPVNSLAQALSQNYPDGRNGDLFRSDRSDWRTVELRFDPDSSDMQRPEGFGDGSNVAQLRAIQDEGVVVLRTPRVLCSTPSIFQMWQTNRDNRFRALVNQCLIMAVGDTFATGDPTTPDIHPFPGVNTNVIPEGTECMGCHKNMDPMVSAFEAHFDYDHQRYRPNSQENADFYRQLSGDFYGYDPERRRNYFPFESFPLPYFSYDGVNQPGNDLFSFARAVAEHPDFATGWALKVCTWASSVPCNRQDPEIGRIAAVFTNSGYRLDRLFHAFFTSKLATHTYDVDVSQYPGAQVSIARRDHFCQAIRVRLRESRRAQSRTDGNINQNTDLCASNRKLSEAVPEGSVQRGAPVFNLPTSNTPFSSISVGNLCSSNLSALVGNGSRTFSANSANAGETIELIAAKLMGYPEQTDRFSEAVTSLDRVYETYRRPSPRCNSASALQNSLDETGPACGLGLSDQQSMEGIVSLACQSPALTTVGL